MVKLLAFKPVIADPLPEKVPENVAEKVPPEKVPAVIVPAVKLPDPSRLTRVEATLALVAVLVALEARVIAELNVFQSVLDRKPLVVLLACGKTASGTVPVVKLLALRLLSDDPLPLKATADKVPDGLKLLREVPLAWVTFHKLAVCPEAP